ncbi:hypothetical protein TWF703_010815 [Orbilia oligospora]|uniref:Uncharacterized protein n=1 Tax=Orbilia oligospora TaxID=2813651 RepID=A0A7C8P289_ORBOL|nr:hypothetical protein TWF703_010815 [Orbilia oligospora]
MRMNENIAHASAITYSSMIGPGMAKFKFCISAFVWLSLIYSTLIEARWVIVEEWGQVLRHRTNLTTGEVEAYHETINSAIKVWDTDKAWTDEICISDVIIEDHAFVRNIEYYTGNPSPLFPYVLFALELHDNNDCTDKNSVTVVFPTERGAKPELFGPIQYEDEAEGEEDVMFEGGDDPQNFRWDPAKLQELLNAPTVVENGFEQNPEDFDSDEVESLTGEVNHGIWNSEADLEIPLGTTQRQGPYNPTIIAEEEYQDLDSESDQGGMGQTNLQKQSPLPPKSEPSEELEDSESLLSFSLPGQGFMDVGTPTNPTNKNGLGQLPMPNFRTNPHPQEQDTFSDISAVGIGNFGFGGTLLDQLASPESNILATQDVVDLEPLVMESRDGPFQDEDKDPTFKIDIYQRGLRFKKFTSIKLISNRNQWYRIPAGGIQART